MAGVAVLVAVRVAAAALIAVLVVVAGLIVVLVGADVRVGDDVGKAVGVCVGHMAFVRHPPGVAVLVGDDTSTIVGRMRITVGPGLIIALA